MGIVVNGSGMFKNVTIRGQSLSNYVEEKKLENLMRPTELEKIIMHLTDKR